MCGATDLGEALRRIAGGRRHDPLQGGGGTGEVSNAVTHGRTFRAEMSRLRSLSRDELFVAAKKLQAPYPLGAAGAPRTAGCTWCCSPSEASRPPTRRWCLGEAMVGLNVDDILQPRRLAEPGW